MSRDPDAEEQNVLTDLLSKQKTEFGENPQLTKELLAGQETNGLPAADLAAWTVVARVLLNLDETITREGVPNLSKNHQQIC